MTFFNFRSLGVPFILTIAFLCKVFLLCRATMFLVPTTLGRRVTRSLVCLRAVSVYVWSGGTGLPKEPDFWTPWVFSDFIFVKQREGGRSSIRSFGLPVGPEGWLLFSPVW